MFSGKQKSAKLSLKFRTKSLFAGSIVCASWKLSDGLFDKLKKLILVKDFQHVVIAV